MKFLRFLAIGPVILAGCASLPMPPEATAIRLFALSSASIEVYRPKLRLADGELVLEGSVYQQRGAETTADSHIDIAYLDATGRELRLERTNFTPRSLPKPKRGQTQPHGTFRAIVQVPAGTDVIEVRGHDGACFAR